MTTDRMEQNGKTKAIQTTTHPTNRKIDTKLRQKISDAEYI